MSNQLVTAQPNESAALMQVITRASSDPAVDVDKLERLLAMYERINSQRSDQAFSDAMSEAQAEMRPIARDSNNPQTHSKYASYGALDNELRPIYTKHGFGLSFATIDCPKPDHIRVQCRVSHKNGHVEKPFLDMPIVTKGAKGNDVMTPTHATMSAVSYARRGLLKMIFNLAEGEFDDDGNGGRNERPVYLTAEQQQTISHILNDNGFSVSVFMQWAQVESMGDILLENYPKILAALRKQIAAKKSAEMANTAAERQAQEFRDAEARANGRIPEDPEIDAGEVEPEVDESEPIPEPVIEYNFPSLRKEIEGKLLKAGKSDAIDALVSEYGTQLNAMKAQQPDMARDLSAAFAARRKKLEG